MNFLTMLSACGTALRGAAFMNSAIRLRASACKTMNCISQLQQRHFSHILQWTTVSVTPASPSSPHRTGQLLFDAEQERGQGQGATMASAIGQVRTMKTKLHLKKRCRDCYTACYKGQWYNLCQTNPRHKQKKLQPRKEFYWILTHATQGKKAWR